FWPTSSSTRCPYTTLFRSFLILRKEVIQPHLPIRLPCYDFTPIIGPTFDGSLQMVRPPASGVTDFRGVTGGVYKTRERIHRGMLIHDSSDSSFMESSCRLQSELRTVLWDSLGLAASLPFVTCPLWHVCSPNHKGHDDLTSSPPSSGL